MRIRWTQLAINDFTRICDYIQEHDSSASARQVALAIYQGVHSLSELPSRGRPGRLNGTREFVFTSLPYLAIYRIHADTVEIARILHGAQKYP